MNFNVHCFFFVTAATQFVKWQDLKTKEEILQTSKNMYMVVS